MFIEINYCHNHGILDKGQDTVTEIYIDLDWKRIDLAMRKVLDEIKQNTQLS